MTVGRYLIGIAAETIPVGAFVLHRGFRVTLAPPQLANGRARKLPSFCPAAVYAAGETVRVDPVDGLGERDLHAMANGQIMDPVRLYLPAGRLSKADADARECADLAAGDRP